MKESIKAAIRPYIRPYQRSFARLKKSARRLVLYPLRKLPISSERWGPPKGGFDSDQSWLASEARYNGQGGRLVAIAPPETLHRAPAKSLDAQNHWKIRKEATHHAPATQLRTLHQARLWVHHNFTQHVDALAIIQRDDKLVGPASYEGFRPDLAKHSIWTQTKLGPVHNLPGQAAILTTIKGEQFYHWMLDLLPKLGLLKAAGVDLNQLDHVVVNSTQSRFMRETLALLGIPEEKIVSCQTYPHLKADTCYVPSPPGFTGNPTPFVRNFLREHFLPLQANSGDTLPRRFYISRANAPFRKVEGEAGLLAVLEPLGFVPVVLESLPMAEQIALFANAEAIVAPHGAGLTHLVFCHPGTRVIEFFSPLYVNACFYAQAQLCELDYYYIIGEGKTPREGVDLEINIANIRLDPEKLRATLALAALS